MPLETATYIHQLDTANPASTDQLSQADEHLRLIKSAIKATFPNLTGPVTATQATLNSTTIPAGVITIWYGSSSTVPLGWAICNGQIVPKSDGSGNITTPDLRDRVVVGAGSVIAAQGATAGATTATGASGAAGSHSHVVDGGAHTHTGSVLGHTLTLDQIPAHTHSVGSYIVDAVDEGGSSPNTVSAAGSTVTGSAGGGQAHSHGLTVDQTAHAHSVSTVADHTHSLSVSTVQPSMGLHYIMKV